MDDGVDAAECGARRGNKFGGRPGIRQVACAPRDLGAGMLTLIGNRFQSLDARRVGALPMQHQARILPCQPARDRGSDPDPAAGDD